MKAYPVTKDELFEIGGVGLLTTAFFSFGGNFIASSFELQAELELNQGIPSPTVAKWQTREH
ncbi:MAG TPA: hypothetical protein VMF12_10650, partial [Xanthobacteraceae bacterium]|nr:hypothetical protein [Xanthobacteraceae bacterium]